MQSTGGLIGLILSLGILVLFLYFAMQGAFGSTDESASSYVQGIDAIDQAEEVKGLMEGRHIQ